MEEILKSFHQHLLMNEGSTPESANKYRSNLGILFDMLKIEQIADLQAQKINKAWLAGIWTTIQEKRGLSDNTIISYQTSLKKFVKYLEDLDMIPRGTHTQIQLAKKTEVHLNGLSSQEKELLRNYLSRNLKTDIQRRNAAMIYFLWSTGCRISEAIRLNVHGDGMIYTDQASRISGDFHIYDGAIYVHIRGKGKRERDIPVSSTAVAYLNLYLENRPDKSSALFISYPKWRPPDRITRHGAYFSVKEVFKAAGIDMPEKVMTHILRHTAIESWILSGKYTSKQIISMTGHSTEEGLEPYYRRSRDLIRVLSEEGSPLNDVKVPKDIQQFEDILKKKYVRS